MSDLPYLNPGDPLPRSRGKMNAIIDAARAHRQLDLTSPPKTVPKSLPYDQNTQILVRNDTGHTFNRYDSVGIDEPIWLPQDGVPETEQHLNEPVYSISRLNHCRHRGRWAVLTEPLPPCGIVRAVMSGGTDAWLASDVPIVAGVNPISVGAAPYHDGALKVLGYPAYEGGQALWAGAHSMPTCSGSVDAVCRADGNKWLITRDTCSEGCSTFSCDLLYWDANATPCTPGEVRTEEGCCPSQLGLIRIGNEFFPNRENCHECFDANCKYECVERHSEWVYQQVRNCAGEEVTPTEAPDPSTTSAPTTAASACSGQCEWIANVGPGGWIVSPTNPWRMAPDPNVNTCDAGANCFCPNPTGYPMSPTETNVFACQHPPQTTSAPSACQCPDLNALVITDPVRYPPCGPAQCPPQILVACDTTTPPPTTIPPSTTPPPTTVPPSTTIPPSTTSGPSTPPPTTPPPTTQGPTTEPPECPGTCLFVISESTPSDWSTVVACFGVDIELDPCLCLPPTQAFPTYPIGSLATCPCCSDALASTNLCGDPDVNCVVVPPPPPPTTAAPTTSPSTTVAPTTAAPTTLPPTTSPPTTDHTFEDCVAIVNGCQYTCTDTAPGFGPYMWLLSADNCAPLPVCGCAPGNGSCDAGQVGNTSAWFGCDNIDY